MPLQFNFSPTQEIFFGILMSCYLLGWFVRRCNWAKLASRSYFSLTTDLNFLGYIIIHDLVWKNIGMPIHSLIFPRVWRNICDSQLEWYLTRGSIQKWYSFSKRNDKITEFTLESVQDIKNIHFCREVIN